MKKLSHAIFALAILASITTFTSCASEDKGNSNESVSTESSALETGSAAMTAKDMALQEGVNTPDAPTGPTTSISFEQPVYDFGTRKTGEQVDHVYKFTNTGSEPLVITNAKGSCGCTVPDWPKEPIPAGGKGEIKVRFDGKGKTGPQSKNVSITANTNPSTTILTIKGTLEGTPEGAQ
jgi:hypothetical protein